MKVSLKKELMLICFIVILSFSVKSQNFEWAKALGGSNGDYAAANTVDSSGNIYIIGAFYGTVDFDPSNGTSNLISTGGFDIFITKFNANGVFIWAKKMGGNLDDFGVSINIDKQGNVLSNGSFNGSADFNPGTLIFTLVSAGNTDIFVSKLDSTGSFIWAKKMGGVDADVARSIATDASGNVYSTGYFNGMSDFDPGVGIYYLTSTNASDVYVSKLNASGDFSWAKSAGGDRNVQGISLSIDASKNIYTIGWYDDRVDFDPSSAFFYLTPASGGSFLWKLDEFGNFVWVRDMGGIGQDIVLDNNKNIYVTGDFNGTQDFDPGFSVYNLSSNAASSDIFISKIDSFGNLVWAKQIGGYNSDRGNSIAKDNSGFLYLTGSFEVTVDFDPGAGIENYSSSGGVDIFILKLDKLGNLIWAKSMGGLNDDSGIDVYVDANENVYTIGNFNSTVDFDPDGGIFNLLSNGYEDIFISKLCSPPHEAGLIIGPSIQCSGSQEKYSISPVIGASSYNWIVPPGSIILNGQNTPSIEIKFGPITGNIIVTPVNLCGNGLSDTLFVKVNSLPIIGYTVQPSLSVCKGSSVTLRGTGALTYNWSSGITDGIPFFPDSTSTYTVSGVDSNGCMSIDTVIVSVIPQPLFKAQPMNQYVKVGSNVQFIAKAMDTNVTYQWQLNTGTGFENLNNSGQYNGVNADTLKINNVTLSQYNYNYRCIIYDGSCYNVSNIAVLNICELTIKDQPTHQMRNLGDAVDFTIDANSFISKYQWQMKVGNGFVNLTNSSKYSGVQGKTFMINKVDSSDNGTVYRCIVNEGNCIDTSYNASLTVCSIVVLTHPIDQKITEGSIAIFKIVTSDSLDKFQWQQNIGTGFYNLKDSDQFSGVTKTVLNINNVFYNQNNTGYRCIVKNGNCVDSTYSAKLIVEKIIVNGISSWAKEFRIYPNPTNGESTFEFTQLNNGFDFFITDPTGRIVFNGIITERKTTFDLKQLASGFYFVHLNGINNATFKLVKE